MLKGAATKICARRLGVAPGRAAALVQAASDAGHLPKAVGSSRPKLGPDELARLVLAVAVDRGLGTAGASVATYADLSAADGTTLADVLAGIIRSTTAAQAAATGCMVLHLDRPRVSLVTGGRHLVFGEPEPLGQAGRHVAVPGVALAAMAIEMQGATPENADALAGIARITR